MDRPVEAKTRPRTMSYFVFTIPIAGVALTAFVATSKSLTTLAAFSITLLGLVLAVRLWAALSGLRLDIQPDCNAKRLYSGEILSLKIDAANRKLLPVWLGLDILSSEALAPLDGNDPVGETSLAPFSRMSGT